MKADDRKAIGAAFALSRRARFVYVTTNGAGGYPSTRMMFNLLKFREPAVARGAARIPDGFSTWLGTNTSSRKVAEARHDPRVCLYYSDTKRYEALTLTGRVEEVHDRAIRHALWTRNWEIYYKGGVEGGDFTVFRFLPERGRYYHALRVVDFDAARAGRTNGARRAR